MADAWAWLIKNRVAVATAVNAVLIGVHTYFATQQQLDPAWLVAAVAALTAIGLPVSQAGAVAKRMLRRKPI